MNYPLFIKFKAISLSNQANVLDENGASLFFIKQKLFKIREKITVFKDHTQTEALCYIQADRVIDWSATYNFTHANGETIGCVKRKGARSLWKAEYHIYTHEGTDFLLQEESAFVRFMDSLIGEVPVLGIFSGYFFNPVYNITRASDGALVMQLIKERALLETGYRMEQLNPLDASEELSVLLGGLTTMILERFRG